MAFNGSGTFARLYNWATDKTNSIKILASRMDGEMDGMATGLSTCITKDGQTTITADLPMAGYNHTGVDDADARDQYASAAQVQDGSLIWVDAGGTADAITAAYSPVITTLVDGQQLGVRAGAANSTTTPSFSPNGLTARTIVKDGGNALVAGDIAGDGHELILRYDLSNTQWEILNPATTAKIGNVVEDTSPQLGGDMDANGNDIQFDDATGIRDNSDNEQLIFQKTASAVNYLEITNAATGNSPSLTSAGSDTDVDLTLTPQADGNIILDGLTFPNADGSANQVLKTDGSGALSFGGSGYLGSAVDATNSGADDLTAVTFSSLPSWAKEITILFSGVSLSGTDDIVLTLGDSGGLETSGYTGSVSRAGGSGTANSSYAGSSFELTEGPAAGDTYTGHITLIHLASNKWILSSQLGLTAGGGEVHTGGGEKTLSAALDRVSITRNGTDTFDGGEINILVE